MFELNGNWPPAPTDEGANDLRPLVVEGDLTMLISERRLVLGYFAPQQRDLADVIRTGLGFRDEAFGVGLVGPVRITIEPLVERPASAER